MTTAATALLLKRSVERVIQLDPELRPERVDDTRDGMRIYRRRDVEAYAGARAAGASNRVASSYRVDSLAQSDRTDSVDVLRGIAAGMRERGNHDDATQLDSQIAELERRRRVRADAEDADAAAKIALIQRADELGIKLSGAQRARSVHYLRAFVTHQSGSHLGRADADDTRVRVYRYDDDVDPAPPVDDNAEPLSPRERHRADVLAVGRAPGSGEAAVRRERSARIDHKEVVARNARKK